MPYLTVGEQNGAPIELYYEDQGAGRPVVLIHGWPLSGRSWEKQVPALVEAGHRVITYDRRGFGKSSQPWSGYDYNTFARDLRTLMMHLKLEDAAIVGFSMGGGEVARYLGTFGSDIVSKAVFAGAVPPFLLITPDNPDGALDAAAVEGFRDGLNADRVAFVDAFVTDFFRVGDRTDLVSRALRQNQADIAAGASPKGTIECTHAFSTTDFRGDLARIDIPTLVIHGDSDAIVPIEKSGERTADLVADCKLVVLPDAPHGLNVTHAAAFNQELIAFLAD